MRRPMIAGNWKLNLTLQASQDLAQALVDGLEDIDDCDVVIAPVYTALHQVAQVLAPSQIGLAAQEIFYKDEGAFTGAVSGPLVRDAGAQYTLVGHSERRQLFAESLATSNLRVHAALQAGLIPILCVGETLSERQDNRTDEVLIEQLEAGIQGLDENHLAQLVIAYEPVWAIGTGQVASTQTAQDAHHTLRTWLGHHDAQAAEQVRILYGGSVKPDNAAELLRQPDIDGALVGGASLKAESFIKIVQARA